jgi:hypothetical protein
MELAHYVFRKSGSWTVVFDGKPAFHLEDTLGARYLWGGKDPKTALRGCQEPLFSYGSSLRQGASEKGSYS